MVRHGWQMMGGLGGAAAWIVLVLVLVLLGATCAVVLTLRQPRDPPREPKSGASRTLDERFARGEIDEDEYRRRCSALLEAHHGATCDGQSI